MIPPKAVVQDFLYHVAIRVGNHTQGADLIVVQGEGGPVFAPHGRGQPLAVIVAELVTHAPDVDSTEADEVKPLIGLDELAIEILGGPSPLFVLAKRPEHDGVGGMQLNVGRMHGAVGEIQGNFRRYRLTGFEDRLESAWNVG